MHKKFLFLISILFLSINFSIKSTEINGKLRTGSLCKRINLYEYMGSALILFDSARVENGNFKFSYPKKIPRGYYRLGTDFNNSLDLIIGDEVIEITGSCDSLRSTGIVKGSLENKANEEYNLYNTLFNENVEKMRIEADKVRNTISNTDPAFQSAMNRFQQRFDSMERAKDVYYQQLALTYKNTFIAKVAVFYTYKRYTDQKDSIAKVKERETFIDKKYYMDEEMSRGVMLEQKTTMYLQKYFSNSLYDWEKEIDKLIRTTPKGSRCRETMYAFAYKTIQEYDKDYVRILIHDYHEEFPNSPLMQNITQQITPPKEFEVGSIPPDIMLKDTSGNPISLYKLRGKIVLLDFWASWCGPCRKENPNVVALYQKYKKRGFTVFSVSLDANKENWKRAIKQDKLEWSNHGSDLLGWGSQPARVYGVSGIPSTFLLNEKGVIVAKNLRGQQLEDKVSMIIGK